VDGATEALNEPLVVDEDYGSETLDPDAIRESRFTSQRSEVVVRLALGRYITGVAHKAEGAELEGRVSDARRTLCQVALRVGNLPECVWGLVARDGKTVRYLVRVSVGPRCASKVCETVEQAILTRDRLRAQLRAAEPARRRTAWRVRRLLLADGSERFIGKITTPGGYFSRTFKTEADAHRWTVELARSFDLREERVERLWQEEPPLAGLPEQRSANPMRLPARAPRRARVVHIWEAGCE
jgi:hypothetical protein